MVLLVADLNLVKEEKIILLFLLKNKGWVFTHPFYLNLYLLSLNFSGFGFVTLSPSPIKVNFELSR